jgi:A/G-specific adenine glycosylase
MPAPEPEPHDAATPQAELLAWYRRVGRDLPWRRTRDPYRILVSEVMLQQTQVDRVIPFWLRFIALFPAPAALAAADPDTLHRAWKGLGYPSRADRLQAACAAVVARGGAWPDTVEGLQELPGIGPYTAGAVACFAFARPVAVVDTNVARVYARRDRLPVPIDRLALWTHAAAEVDRHDPIAYTNALMDLGATVCTARAADCPRCPWQGRCATAGDRPGQLATANPLKVASPKVAYGAPVTDRTLPRLRIVLALVHHDGRYLVARRPADKHAGGAWELPGGKREPGEDDRAAIARELREEVGGELLSARALVSFSHAYPDRYLTFHCYRCRLFNPDEVKPLQSDGLRWVTPEEFVALAFPPANAPLVERMRKYHRLAAS